MFHKTGKKLFQIFCTKALVRQTCYALCVRQLDRFVVVEDLKKKRIL